MKKIGIVIDKYKLPIFKRHLDAGGYKYEESPGVTKDTLLLTVHSPTIAQLQPVIIAAEKETLN